MAKFEDMYSEDIILNAVKEKWARTFKKNTGIKRLLDLEEEQSNDIEYSKIDLCALKYAPVVSVDCERSFSMYKSFFRDNRHGFVEENQLQYILLYCNGDF